MSTFFSKVKGFFDLGGAIASAVELVGDIAKLALGADGDENDMLRAAEAGLESIVKIVDTVRAGVAGDKTPAEIMAELAKVRAGISGNDKAADAAVDDKFPPGEP